MKIFEGKLSQTLMATLLLTLTAQAGNLAVDCRPGGKGLTTIGAAIAQIAAESVKKALPPTTITVTGTCVENVSITNLDNITLQASPAGATITDASNGNLDTVAVADSNRFALNGFTINGSVDCFDDSVCRLFGNTIQNSQTGYGLRAGRASIDSSSDNISNNPSGSGVLSVNQARIVLVDDTINNNGGHGVAVQVGALVILTNSATTNTISNNAGFGILAQANATVRLFVANITGNGNDGVRVLNGSVFRMDFASPTVNNITGNGGSGVNLGDLSHAFFANDGSVNITGNLSGTDIYCAGQFAATRNVASTGGTTNCSEPNPNSPKRK
jgi:hypothetical protein